MRENLADLNGSRCSTAVGRISCSREVVDSNPTRCCAFFIFHPYSPTMGEINRDCPPNPDRNLRSGVEDDPEVSGSSGSGCSFDLDCRDQQSGRVGMGRDRPSCPDPNPSRPDFG